MQTDQRLSSRCPNVRFSITLIFVNLHHKVSLGVWVLPFISLLLTNTVSLVRASLNHMMGEVSWDPKRRRSWVSYYAILSGVSYSLLPTGIGERYRQTISNLCQAALLRRCELHLSAKVLNYCITQRSLCSNHYLNSLLHYRWAE